MTYQDLQGNLHNILIGCATQIEKLAALLQDEHAALTARDVAAVEACTKRKHELLAHLEILDRQRNEASALLDNHNEAGNNGVASDDDFTELKQQIKTLLDKCRHQNDINGAIIDISTQFSKRILEVMLGVASSESLYDSTGRNSKTSSYQSVARI